MHAGVRWVCVGGLYLDAMFGNVLLPCHHAVRECLDTHTPHACTRIRSVEEC